MSCLTVITHKIIARILIIFLAFLVGINAFGLYAPDVSAAAGPDLIAKDITLSPADPIIDDTVTITVAVKNQGTVNAGFSYVACYVDSTILDTKSIASLGAGITTTVAFSWNAVKGSHVVKAVVDSSEVIAEADETNNIKTFNFSTLAPDLAIQSLSWSPENPSKGDNIVFTVIVKNQGSSKSNTTDITLYIDGVLKDSQSINALNPGGTVTKTFNWIALPGQHAVKAAVDENNYNNESSETNNEQSITFLTLPPDLIIEAVTWTPENPSRGDMVTFTATVKNQGSGRADTCQLGYYVDNNFISVVPINTLEAAASSNVTFTWTTQSDTHILKLVADYYNAIAESDETNNENTVSLATVAPDLIIEEITWAPEDAGVGDVITFTVIIKNQGNGKAGACHATYYVSGDYRGYIDIPQLDIGQEVTRTFQYTAEFESINLTFTVDCYGTISETRENNNTLTISISIILPDLVISNIEWLPTNPAIDDYVTFTITLKNQNSGKADNIFTGFYVDDALLDSNSIYTLGGGASANLTFIWQAQNGRHIFKAVADYTRHVTESDETNNERAVTIIPLMPDLAIGTVTWSPQDTPAGNEVTFDVKIQNLGTLRASTSRVAFYVDGAVVGYAYIGSLEPGAAVTEHFTWVATDGPHEIDIVADANDQVIEIDETNNTRVVSLPPPDLIVQEITISPADSSIGDVVVITASIKNLGSSRTQSSLVSLLVDGLNIASRDLPPIDAGDSCDVLFDWVAEAGIHTFAVTADENNTVIESNETNNDKETEFATLTPDLLIQSISWETADQLSSNEVSFTITVKNIGTGTAGDYKLQYSFDDALVITKDMLPLAAGTTADFTFIAILSLDSHTANITIDSDYDVIELDEDNNESIYSFSTIAADLIVRTITWSPLDAVIGDAITITAKVENRGTFKATNTRVTLTIDGAAIGYVDVPEIAADALAAVDFSWTAMEGQHEISVLADAGQAILESNESNNGKVRSISFEKLEIATKKAASLPVLPSDDGGFLSSWWWLLLLIAAILGVGAFVSAYRASRKKY